MEGSRTESRLQTPWARALGGATGERGRFPSDTWVPGWEMLWRRHFGRSLGTWGHVYRLLEGKDLPRVHLHVGMAEVGIQEQGSSSG